MASRPEHGAVPRVSSRMTERRPAASLVDAPVGETLLRLTGPMMLGIFAVLFFNVVDTYFVGQLGPIPLAAMSFTFPVTFVVISITMGLGIGVTSAVSRAVGSRDEQAMARLTTDGLLLSLLVVLFVSSAGLLAIDPLFSVLGATPELLPLVRSYMVPWFAGVGVLVVPLIGNSATRARGDAKTPALIMMAAGLMNAIFDPLLIFGIGPFPRLELAGAAIATVLSWSIALIAALYMLGPRDRMLTFARPGKGQVLASFRAILFIGLPAAGTQLLVPLSGGVLSLFGSSAEPWPALSRRRVSATGSRERDTTGTAATR